MIKTTGFQEVKVGMIVNNLKVVKIEETDYKQTPSGVNPYLKLILETGEEIYNSYILHGDI
tara:strand:- start:1808 stop:1990 length:183 start_codon:yes stop_codon:yes gene_type:complete